MAPLKWRGGHNNLTVFTKQSRKSALKLSVISSEQLPYEGCLRKNIFSNLFILTVSLCKSIFRSFALESKNKKKVVGGEGKYRKKRVKFDLPVSVLAFKTADIQHICTVKAPNYKVFPKFDLRTKRTSI